MGPPGLTERPPGPACATPPPFHLISPPPSPPGRGRPCRCAGRCCRPPPGWRSPASWSARIAVATAAAAKRKLRTPVVPSRKKRALEKTAVEQQRGTAKAPRRPSSHAATRRCGGETSSVSHVRHPMRLRPRPRRHARTPEAARSRRSTTPATPKTASSVASHSRNGGFPGASQLTMRNRSPRSSIWRPERNAASPTAARWPKEGRRVVASSPRGWVAPCWIRTCMREDGRPAPDAPPDPLPGCRSP
jgi:hypothetical protein